MALRIDLACVLLLVACSSCLPERAGNPAFKRACSEARALIKAGRFKEAVAAAPMWGEAHGRLGLELAASGSFTQALESLAEACALAPRAQASRWMYEASLVAPFCDRLPEIGAEAGKRFDSGLRNIRGGDLHGALGDFWQAATMAPWWPEAQHNLSVTATELGAWEMGIAAAERYANLMMFTADAPAAHKRATRLRQKRPSGQ